MMMMILKRRTTKQLRKEGCLEAGDTTICNFQVLFGFHFFAFFAED